MKPTLVILAAGMGSRYGGLKQIDTIGSNGESIIDFTIFDAIEAGFKKIVLIIRKEHEEVFETHLVSKIRSKIEVEYAYQDLNDIPEGIVIPQDRVKPWGTSHALLACRNIVKDPFVICNADDYYGKDAFKKIYQFLVNDFDDNTYAMVGYKLTNTLSDYGSVTRGYCHEENGYLVDIRELMKIKKDGDKVIYDENGSWNEIDANVAVSMNFWGFKPSVFAKVNELFASEIVGGIKDNPLKYEALLPNYVGKLVSDKNAKVKVLTSEDSWFGVTYQEDKPTVVAKIQKFKDQGLYPFDLWK
ncbi:MAG: sugar phosphate nucleotidyltransferase [Erysipelotrichaceae bacterium]|nr:sugar phosphate nucleotidyltransferase [Erysipelotrichaceae bacterium]